MTKSRLLTGTYVLQSNRAKYSLRHIPDTCLLCGEGEEDRVHFLAVCSKLSDTRMCYLGPLTNALMSLNTLPKIKMALSDPNLLTQIVLDCTSPLVGHLLSINQSVIHHIERLSRNMCYALHLKRQLLDIYIYFL